jgi:hypothetical protein
MISPCIPLAPTQVLLKAGVGDSHQTLLSHSDFQLGLRKAQNGLSMYALHNAINILSYIPLSISQISVQFNVEVLFRFQSSQFV